MRFGEAQEAVGRLYALAQALVNDYERFEALVGGEERARRRAPSAGTVSTWPGLRATRRGRTSRPRRSFTCATRPTPTDRWHGVGPLESAALAGRLSAETADALADGESGPRGGVLPLPVDGEAPDCGDAQSGPAQPGRKAGVRRVGQHDAARSRGLESAGRLETLGASARTRRSPRSSC